MFSSKQLASPSLSIDTVHDGRHVLDAKPLARESIPFIVVLPKEQVAFFTYTWVNAQGVAAAACALFGPGVGKEPIQQRLPDQQIPAGQNFDNWALGGFNMRSDLAFNKAGVQWHSPALKLEFAFEAYHPPYAYGSHPQGCPPYAAHNRIEQAGLVHGELEFNNKKVQFSATGHRDHSWGTRDWLAMQHYEWFVGQTDEGVAVHFWRIQALGQITLRGYVYKGGLMAAVRDLDLQVDFNGAYWQTGYKATVTDELGRKTTVEAECFSHYTLVPDPSFHLRESGASAKIDGAPSVGWMEVAWPKSYLDHIANGNS
jgi:hypothetical protein